MRLATNKETRKLETSPVDKISTFWLAGFAILMLAACILYIISRSAIDVGALRETYTESAMQAPAAPPVDPEKQAAFVRFEEILNGFLQDVQANMRQYRQQRRILTEMVDPFNLRQPDYITENYSLLQTAAPGLRAKMDDVVAPFEAAQAQIYAALADQSEATKQNVWLKWETLKQKQLSLYIQYFAIEDHIISAYEDLLGFYYQNQNSILVDSEFISVSFADPALEEQEHRLLSRIEDLTAEQSLVLKSKPQTTAVSDPAAQTY